MSLMLDTSRRPTVTDLSNWKRIAADLANHLNSAQTLGFCPDCETTLNRYRAMRDGTLNTHDTTVTPYAGSPEHRQ